MRKSPFVIVILVALVAILPLSVSSLKAAQSKSAYEKPIDAKYLNVGKKEYMLVFYGYVGCVNVCSPVLDTLNRFYSSDSFAKFEPFVDLIFVNLLPNLLPEQPDQYAKSFNPKFIGIYLTQKEITGIDKELNLYLSKRAGDPFELDHSDHLYLIKREKNGNLMLINTYTTHPLTDALILDDLSQYTHNSQ